MQKILNCVQVWINYLVILEKQYKIAKYELSLIFVIFAIRRLKFHQIIDAFQFYKFNQWN